MKAIFLATALAITAMHSRAADESIEFALDTPTAVFLTEGEPLTLKPRIVRGTGISFQWYRVYPGWGTNAIARATNLVFHIDPAVDTDYGAYLLRATNSVSEASTLIDAYVLPLPDFDSFLGGWEGNQSDSYQLLYRPYVYPVEQWYKDGVPIPPPSPTGILNEQTQGAYWVTVTNELGNRFFSRPAVLRITPVTEVVAKFRHVSQPPSDERTRGRAAQRTHERGRLRKPFHEKSRLSLEQRRSYKSARFDRLPCSISHG